MNIIEEKGPEGTTTYEYNPLNQQIKVITHQGHIQVNRYDAEGLRVEIEENERLTKFIFHKENVLVETDQEDNAIARLIRGYEVVASDLTNVLEENKIEKNTSEKCKTNYYYYSQDEQGSTLYITNEEQVIENAYIYDAFGNILTKEENIQNRITYAGQQYDTITQQYYLRARYYNPIMGIFTQEDVYIGDGLNLYAYCANNPVNYYDPSGYKKSEDICGPKKQQMCSAENDSNIQNEGSGASNTSTRNQATYDTPINTGKSMPPNKSTPNSIYEQINPDNTVKSRAFYDQNGNQFSRQDFDHPHFDKKTKQYYQPHEHNYKYNDNGLPAGKSDGPLPPGYNNMPTD